MAASVIEAHTVRLLFPSAPHTAQRVPPFAPVAPESVRFASKKNLHRVMLLGPCEERPDIRD
eukprot:scaffold334_cov241-Pinguiococcus_pyrenoidosus.AAC.56